MSLIDEKNLYDKYIDDSPKLFEENQADFILKYIIENKVIGRIFLNKKKEEKYYEIFEEERFKILGLPKKITLLYLPEKNKTIYDKTLIGFRFYKNADFFQKEKYYTLIKKYRNKYYILEKNNNIKDILGNTFLDDKLDCLEIINEIIYEKYINIDEKRFPIGVLFPELIAFCYAVLSYKKIK